MANEFYLQDTRSCVGNSMTWWKHDNCGYVCDIRKAKVFTQEDLNKRGFHPEDNKKAWPKEYIDARISHHIDMQHCNHEEAIA